MRNFGPFMQGPFKHGMRRGDHGEAFGGGGGGRGGGRVFGHGGLRLVLLQLIADKPSHGYELIKAIEERLGGRYSPSPGTVYPTLTLLEELGHVRVDEADGGGRKRYTITDGGREHLEANRAQVDEMMARMGAGAESGRFGRPAQVVRAVENLKLAMRMRIARGGLTQEQANAFASVLDNAAQQIERL